MAHQKKSSYNQINISYWLHQSGKLIAPKGQLGEDMNSKQAS